jgi:hypothetical protein
MPATWNLRSLLKERGISRASEISRIVQRNGYQLSTQAVCDLLNAQPKFASKRSRHSVTPFTFGSAISWKFYRLHQRSHKRRREVSRDRDCGMGGYTKRSLRQVLSEREIPGLVQV